MTHRRVIYNDDFRTIISADQPTSGFPSTAEDLAGLVERVGGTGVTTYVMDSVGFDNKVFFDTQRGVRWGEMDFTKYGGDWDASYGAANRFLDRLRADGREALEIVIDSCRKIEVEALAGARMNDCQGVRPLVEADVSSIPPSALRSGVNRLWVQFGGRREDYTFDPAIGDLEIRTVR